MIDLTHTDFTTIAALLYPGRGRLFADAPVKLIGIRGANDAPGAQNSFAHYDDLIVVDIQGIRSGHLASTDPSWALVVHPIVPEGAAQLCPGIHLFGKHLMHGKYPCLCQAEDVHINRLNKDGTINHADCGQFGICIHSGGEGMDTGRFSAGCQIIENPDGYFQDPAWSAFWDPIRDAMTRLSLETVPYLLINKSDIH